jgi:hypothetical protein
MDGDQVLRANHNKVGSIVDETRNDSQTSRYKWGYLVGLVLLLLLSGCELSELTFTRARPNREDLVGTWTPTSETIKDMKGRGGYPISNLELVLNGDGTFSLANMPDWWLDGFGDSHAKLFSTSGKWELMPDEDVWTVWTLELEFPPHTVHDGIHVTRQKPPYLLQFTLGDPDSSHCMLFEKK